jgi:multidrug resistance efflux pump
MPQSVTKPPDSIVLVDREPIQYLIGAAPSWMMRYGISAFSICFLITMALGYAIEYPDTIEAKIVITTAQPPIHVPAPSSNRISHLLIKNDSIVSAGSAVAVLANAADWQEVKLLDGWVEQVKDFGQTPPTLLKLGSIQDQYAALCQHWNDYKYFNQSDAYERRMADVDKQIGYLGTINQNLRRQKTILLQELDLVTIDLTRQQQLHHEKLISSKELNQSELNSLQQNRQLESISTIITQNELSIQQLENQKNELNILYNEGQNSRHLILREDLQRLRSAIDSWKQQYLIIAPISGRISLSKIWSPQQSIAAGEEVFVVVPESKDILIGKLLVPGYETGKLQLGNKAIIKLDAFPAAQHGFIEGKVAYISTMPTDQQYNIDVHVPANLQTSYGNVIPFRQEMTGQVRIVTEERCVLERIFDQISRLIKDT